MRRTILILVLLLTALGVSRAQETKRPPATPTPQPAQPPPLNPAPQPTRIASLLYLGEPAPDFELDGSQGRPVRLRHLRGSWTLLVFADRRTDLAALKGIEPDLRRLDVRPYGICADKAHVLKAYAERQDLPFVLLSDFTGEICQLYGLYDTIQRQIQPGFVLMDRQGVVRMALLGQKLPLADMLSLVRSSLTGS